MSTFHDLNADLPNGSSYDFAQLKGKVTLIVNVASQWYASLSLLCPE
jgi:peroxiredoxin